MYKNKKIKRKKERKTDRKKEKGRERKVTWRRILALLNLHDAVCSA